MHRKIDKYLDDMDDYRASADMSFGRNRPITRAEIRWAKERTKPDDMVRVIRVSYNQEGQVVNREKLRVRFSSTNLCVFDTGESVSWADMALYYRMFPEDRALTMRI